MREGREEEGRGGERRRRGRGEREDGRGREEEGVYGKQIVACLPVGKYP